MTLTGAVPEAPMMNRYLGPGGGLRVVCGNDPSLEFADPHTIFSPTTPAQALQDLERADDALRDGYWIAGYLTYELGYAFHGAESAQDGGNLFTIGVFDAPSASSDSRSVDPVRLSPLLPRLQRRAYDAAIAAIGRGIRDGDVYQVNYAVPFDFELDGDPFSLWRHIARETGARYQAYVQDGQRSILSWSPELFLRCDGDRVETHPMKGTAPFDRPHELASAKNQAEHLMIVDLMRNDLHQIAAGVRVESLMSVETYPSFHTMISRVAGTIAPNLRLTDLLRATFPSGSITGAPKRAAMAAIAALEGDARGVYCGSIGYLSPERRGWWNVAIRTAQIEGTSGTFHAGGGIVCDSTAAEEWEEVATKTAFFRAHGAPLELREAIAADANAAILDMHVARLEQSARAFNISINARAIRRAAHEAKAANPRSIIKLRVTADGRVSIVVESLVRQVEPARACLAQNAVKSTDRFLAHKTSWRPHHDLAWQWAQARGCFDAILRNERGECTEGSRTNLFVQIGGKLWTPPIECGLLPGILRSVLVHEGRVAERVIVIDDLLHAQAIFLGNSARGLVRVAMVEA